MHDAVLHFVKRIVFFRVNDSADVVFAEIYLAVIGGFGVYCSDFCQVGKMGHDSRCAEVNSDSEVSFVVVAGFNLDNLGSFAAAAYGYGNLVVAALQQFG